MIMNAKKSLSSYQLARHLKLKQKTAWFIMTRIRAEMASKGNQLLKEIIEADDAYMGAVNLVKRINVKIKYPQSVGVAQIKI